MALLPRRFWPLIFVLPIPAWALDAQWFDIPAQSLSEALRVFAGQAKMQLLYKPDVVGHEKSNAVTGEYGREEALQQLLKDTGLEVVFSKGNVATIRPIQSVEPGKQVDALRDDAEDSAAPTAKGDKSLWNRVLVAQADQGSSNITSVNDVSQSSSEKSQKSAVLEEVIVTAQKRSERLQDVPVPVTVLDAQSLAENNLNRIQDYFASVPGLTLNASSGAPGGGRQFLSIRGLAATFVGTPSVAFVIDDVPFGSSTSQSNGAISYPDVDPNDLARIEVLKGPQGTLYGADSIGGLIKIVTQDPSTSQFSGRAEILGNRIIDGGPGYGFRGAVNIPISDSFAVRASGFTRRDPGYIDNITTGQDNVNSVDVYGGRLAGLWRPTDTLSIKIAALVQNSYGNGNPTVNATVDPADGKFQPAQGGFIQTGLPGTGTYRNAVQFYSATVNAKVSGLDIISLTGYGINRSQYNYDATLYGLAPLVFPQFPTASGSAALFHQETDKLTQELRVSSSVGHWLDWLAGGFYTHETQPNYYGAIDANDINTGAYIGNVYTDFLRPDTFSERALFGDVTFHATDRFDIQLGGREAWNSQAFQNIYTGQGVGFIFGQSSPYAQPEQRSTGDAFTFLVVPEYKFSQDLMVYLRVASGYQVGGPNVNTAHGEPRSYNPSTTKNYEVGIKGDLYGHRLSFAVSTYYIDWHDIQIFVEPTPVMSYTANGGRAKSTGVEFSIQARPLAGLQASASGSYSDAVLTQDMPAHSSIYGRSGDPLPYNSRYSGTLALDQDLVHVGGLVTILGASASYVDRRYSEFPGGPPPYGPPPENIARFQLPGYTTVNAHLSARSASWFFNLFCNNLTNTRGQLGGNNASNAGNTSGAYLQLIQPRTVGLSITKSFQ